MAVCGFFQGSALGGAETPYLRQKRWCDFIDVAYELGYSVKILSSYYLSHEINCTREDLDVIIELAKDRWSK